MPLSRRTFVSSLGAGAAVLSTSALTQQAHAQLVYTRRGEWDAAGFEKLTHVSARTKQVFDVRDIGAGKFLSNVKNSLNAFHYGFGIPNDQIKIVVALHGASNTLSFDDAMWKKYRLGEFVNLTDPVTGKPAVRNLYLQKATGRSTKIDDRKSEFQDASIQALQSRNVQFLSCHTATEEQAEAITKKFGLAVPVEETAKNLQAHILPGVLIVPGMTAAVSLLQSEGHYTYITV